MVSEGAHTHMLSSTQSVCLLVGAFSLLTSKVMIDLYGPVNVFLVDFDLLSVGLFLFLVFPA